jgi:hypothetical protein
MALETASSGVPGRLDAAVATFLRDYTLFGHVLQCVGSSLVEHMLMSEEQRRALHIDLDGIIMPTPTHGVVPRAGTRGGTRQRPRARLITVIRLASRHCDALTANVPGAVGDGIASSHHSSTSLSCGPRQTCDCQHHHVSPAPDMPRARSLPRFLRCSFSVVTGLQC